MQSGPVSVRSLIVQQWYLRTRTTVLRMNQTSSPNPTTQLQEQALINMVLAIFEIAEITASSISSLEEYPISSDDMFPAGCLRHSSMAR